MRENIDITTEKIKLFNSINIEINSMCNRRCYFCPVAYGTRDDKLMPMEMIEKIMWELWRMDYKGIIGFYVYNEPTRDKRLEDILRLYKKHLRSCDLRISTNGDYLKSKEDIMKYFDAGLNQMQINIYSAKDGSDTAESGIEFARKRYELISGWVNELFGSQSSMYNKHAHRHQVCRVVPKFGIKKNVEKSDLPPGVDNFSNRSGNVPGFKAGLSSPLKKMCTRPFRNFLINWEGNAILCCNDYSGETANFGNANTHTVLEMWNHPEFHKYRLFLQNKRRDIGICAACDYSGGYYTHLIETVTFGSHEADAKILNHE